MATLVRIDLRLTQAEAEEVSSLLSSKLGGFGGAFDRMIAAGTPTGTHFEMVYSSAEAEKQFRAEGL